MRVKQDIFKKGLGYMMLQNPYSSKLRYKLKVMSISLNLLDKK